MKFTNVKEISIACAMSEGQVSADIIKGKLKATKVSGKWRVLLDDALPYIRKRLEEPICADDLLKLARGNDNETR